jgi:hypothetical protein
MNLNDYKITIAANGFDEQPLIIFPGMLSLESFIIYQDADVDLKIYLAKLILCRNFSATGGNDILTDPLWFIRSFISCYEKDLIKPWLTEPIREGMEMILSEDAFSKGVIGTTFMFGIVEFYAKYLLGWKPEGADFFDTSYHRPYRTLFIGAAINGLKKLDNELANALNEIDEYCVQRLQERGIEEKRWIKPKIADRLALARNTMLHGENHSFYSIGKYLCMLYILFYLCDQKRR